ncbi:DUF6882 domain-containing protein [Streptomyces sp. NPDC127066]|uniref:DUF6882 domain-containing protein n=1 Tax=Streptomyces sp. NPDC127066 TaxID=3347125 RepID=UPI0036602A52
MKDSLAHNHSAWEEAALDAQKRAGTRQHLMIERFGSLYDKQCHWSLDNARITWSCGGEVCFGGRITVIGSLNLSDMSRQPWLWSWANESLPRAALGDIERVREFGEANGFPVLSWPSLDDQPKLVSRAKWVAASVLDAEGLWTVREGDLILNFLLHDLAPIGRGA